MGKGSRRRPVWIGAIVVVLFLSGVTLAVSALGGGPDIPHPAGGERAACTGCHTIDGLPSSHRDRSDDGCGSCHAESGEAGAVAEPDGGAAAGPPGVLAVEPPRGAAAGPGADGAG